MEDRGTLSSYSVVRVLKGENNRPIYKHTCASIYSFTCSVDVILQPFSRENLPLALTVEDQIFCSSLEKTYGVLQKELRVTKYILNVYFHLLVIFSFLINKAPFRFI